MFGCLIYPLVVEQPQDTEAFATGNESVETGQTNVTDLVNV